MKNISKFNKFKVNESVDDYSLDDIEDLKSLKDDAYYMQQKLDELNTFVNQMRFFYPDRPDILENIEDTMNTIHSGGKDEKPLSTNARNAYIEYDNIIFELEEMNEEPDEEE